MKLMKHVLFFYKHYAIITKLLFILQAIRRLEQFRHSWIGRKLIKMSSS